MQMIQSLPLSIALHFQSRSLVLSNLIKYIVNSQFSLCLKKKVEAQNENLNVHSLDKSIFFFESFIHCMRKMQPHDPMYKKATDAYILCIEKHGEDIFDAGIAYMNGMIFRSKYIEMSYIKKSKT